jgi:uncharacterized membrane protein
VCNDSGQPLLAAIAQTGPGKASSRGWWRIAPKACARMLATPLTGPIYLLAQTLAGAPLVGGGEKFCTAAAAFEVQDRGNCAAHSMNESGFAATGRGLAGTVVHVGPQGLVR